MFYRLRPKHGAPGRFAVWERSDHDLDSPLGQHNLRDDAFPDFEPEFSPVVLSRKSSLVDFVRATGVVGGTGLLVSDKALAIVEALKLPPCRAYPLEVVHKEKRVAAPRYFWLQILLLDNYGWIDFARSTFSVRHHLDMDEEPGEPLRPRDERELKSVIEAKKSDHYFEIEKLALGDVYARSPFDLFYFDHLGGLASLYPIVTERVKAALEKGGVTGYELTERPEIVMPGG